MADYLFLQAQDADRLATEAANDSDRTLLLQKAQFFRAQARLELQDLGRFGDFDGPVGSPP
jgi:hypothetical protein